MERLKGGDHNASSSLSWASGVSSGVLPPQASLTATACWLQDVARMQCRKPHLQGNRAFGCGQCIPCRINRRRVWTHRIMLEAKLHADNAFVTLTYADDQVPEGNSLNPKELQDFLKRLRSRIEPLKIRYFAVGEYSDAPALRPHYHLVVFGLPTCRYGVSQYSKTKSRCCAACDLVADVWSRGHIMLGTVEPKSVRYVSGYVVKKLSGLHEQLYADRYPEFARMSLRPGLGYGALAAIVKEWEALDLERSQVDVPVSLRHAAAKHPLGRYLVHKLRRAVGRSENAPLEVQIKQEAKLYDLRLAARNDQSQPSFKKKIIEKYRGQADFTEARYRNFQRRKSL